VKSVKIYDGRIKFIYEIINDSRPYVEKYMCSSEAEEYIEFDITNEEILMLRDALDEYLNDETALYNQLSK
jgi:hypothetical protein